MNPHMIQVVAYPVVILAFLLAGEESRADEASRPNILFLFADDQRADTINAHGNPHIETPNLDRLVRKGYSFRRNYCFGSNSGAVCVPSRAMLMSGRHYFAVDHQLTDVVTLPQLLGQNGYTTFATGKWHNGAPALVRSFTQANAVMLGGMSDHLRVPIRDLQADGGMSEVRTGAKHSSELFADAAIDFLQNYQEEAPFFAYVAFTAPHDPRQPPPEYRTHYDSQPPPLPANFMPQHPFDNGSLVLRDENLAAWPRTPETIRDQLAEYYGLITHLDDQIGRILAALEQTGRADNTLVIYAADHGLALGSHGLLGKQSVYEHSMRCPLVFVGNNIPAGGSSQALTYLFDIYPTVCDILGMETPDGLAGDSLQAIWTGEKEAVRNSMFLAYQEIMRAVGDGRWKLIRYPHINHTQLFDLEADPHELNNLAAEPAQAQRVENMLEQLRAWQQEIGDRQALSTENPRPFTVDLTGAPRKPDKWQPQWIVEKYFSKGEE
jgi:arylsulfatase A-like enzyme